MKPRVHGRFADVGIPIRVRLLSGSGAPAGIGGRDHSHDFTELLVFHGGRGIHRVEEHDYPVTAGDIFVVTGDQTHAIVGRDDLQHTEVHFSPARLRLPGAQLRKLPGYHALFVLEPERRRRGRFVGHLHLGPTRLAEAMQIVHGMQREYEGRAAGYEALLLGRLIELIVFLSREYSRATSGDAQALLRLGEVISVLEREYRRTWRLADLAAVARMSRSNLAVVFREATGLTPIQYLIHVRLREAMYLLRGTDRSVTDIAYDVGLSDSNYLARQFRKALGTTPTAYRRADIHPDAR